jgi:hypothetical protein
MKIINKGYVIEQDSKFRKINILTKSDGSEGLWVYIESLEDLIKYDSDSKGEEIKVILANQPVLVNLKWGDELTVLTNGKNRPVFDESDLHVVLPN